MRIAESTQNQAQNCHSKGSEATEESKKTKSLDISRTLNMTKRVDSAKFMRDSALLAQNLAITALDEWIATNHFANSCNDNSRAIRRIGVESSAIQIYIRPNYIRHCNPNTA